MNISDAERLFGLRGGYTLSDVRASYKNLAKQYHPDQNGNSQASIYFMQQINEANALLENSLEKCAAHKWVNDASTQRREGHERAEQRLKVKNDALYAIVCRLIADDNIQSLKKAIPILECDLAGWKDSESLLDESRKRLARLLAEELRGNMSAPQ